MRAQPFRGLNQQQRQLMAKLLATSFISQAMAHRRIPVGPTVYDRWMNNDILLASSYIGAHKDIDRTIAKASEFITPRISTVKKQQEKEVQNELLKYFSKDLVPTIIDEIVTRELEVGIEYEKTRYWQEQAKNDEENTELYTYEQRERMRGGLAPQRTINGQTQTKELHLVDPVRKGEEYTFREVWPE